MRILIDIGHPGHVHLFRPFALSMISRGHEILFTCREKEFEIDLLKAAGFRYVSFGKKFKTIAGKLFGLIKFDILELLTALKFKPDIYLSHGSMYAAQVAWLLRKPHIALEDTFNVEQMRLYKPFSTTILSPEVIGHPDLGEKNIRYSGCHELAYLHPKVFTPDPNVIADLGLRKEEEYVIIRFVSWNATHDIGQKGLSLKNKIDLVGKVSEHVKVFISSEGELPPELEKFKFPLKPERMHDALAFSSMVYGEGATMTTEAAVLGIPSIYINSKGPMYTKDIERNYRLIHNFSESEQDQVSSIEKAMEKHK